MLSKNQEVCRGKHCSRPYTWGPVSTTAEPCICSIVLQSPLPRICKSGDISYALTFIINVLALVTALRVHPGGWGTGMAVFPVRRDFRPAGEEKHSCLPPAKGPRWTGRNPGWHACQGPQDLVPAQLCLWASSAPPQGVKPRSGNERKQMLAQSTSEPQTARGRYGCVGPVSGAGTEMRRWEGRLTCCANKRLFARVHSFNPSSNSRMSTQTRKMRQGGINSLAQGHTVAE